MVRIVGIDLPNEKRLDIALTYIYGVGRSNAVKILKKANMDGSRRVHTLTDEEARRLTKALDDGFVTEGNLRQERAQNIKRLKEIGTYRGTRHTKNLPARGHRVKKRARPAKLWQ
jgi:small subunit ribosomal protein S13